MTQHRGRWVGLVVGLLLTGLPLVPGVSAARAKTVHKAADSLAGRGMWVWYVSRSSSGSLSSIIFMARHYGLSAVMVKSGDGTSMWSQFNPALVSTLHANGLRVCAWQYVYGNHPITEAYVGAQAVHDGADCLIIDAESEYEGKYVAAQSYMTQLRKLIGPSFPVALAGFPYIDYHPGFPYSVFLGPGGAQDNSPQMYWVDIGTSVNSVYAHTYAYNRIYGRGIYPLGQVYRNPPMGQIIRFRQLSRTYGAGGVSWWVWQQATLTGWKAISIGAGNLTGLASTATTPVLGLGSTGDLVVWLQEHLVSVGYATAVDGDFGPTTQAAVQQFQSVRGLTADGIVGPATWAALLRYAPAAVTWTHTGAVAASAAAARGAHAGRALRLAVPKSAHLHAMRNEIAGAGGRG
ncbi:MAG: peptidoglycan-binding protein [Solirubrobacterales bacterium]|nr:peptidoglycan-binding protein [Solirubrobacterales bacterium]